MHPEVITRWWGHSCFRRWDCVVYVYIHIVVVVYVDVLCDALHQTACKRLNEKITLIYSAAVLDTNSEPTSVSLRTLVSEISSIVLTVSSPSICTLNPNSQLSASAEFLDSAQYFILKSNSKRNSAQWACHQMRGLTLRKDCRLWWSVITLMRCFELFR